MGIFWQEKTITKDDHPTLPLIYLLKITRWYHFNAYSRLRFKLKDFDKESSSKVIEAHVPKQNYFYRVKMAERIIFLVEWKYFKIQILYKPHRRARNLKHYEVHVNLLDTKWRKSQKETIRKLRKQFYFGDFYTLPSSQAWIEAPFASNSSTTSRRPYPTLNA